MTLTNNSMLTPLLAEVSGGHLIAIAAILGGLTFTTLLIVFGLKYIQRRQELWHETARIALEKGQPLPPLPRDMQPAKEDPKNTDVRIGLVMIATGAGLYLFFETFIPPLRFIAAIPGFIGAVLLLYGLFGAFGRKDKPANRDSQS
jgi:hypothetical protein